MIAVPLDDQLFDFMPHVVTIKPYASRNNYGETQTGASRTARAYVEPGVTLTEGVQVFEQSRSVRAYIADTNITAQDEITLPDGTTPEIRVVERHVEVPGLEHTVVTFE